MLEKVSDTHDLYLLTLTCQNCSAEEYNDTVDRMLKAYNTLHRYLAGHQTIKGYDLSHLGYIGSVRAFETTFNVKKREIGQEYHPHVHAIIAISKDVLFQKNTLNRYSEQFKTVYKDGKKERVPTYRKFSQFETEIQRIWWLLMNGQRVTLDKIKDLNEEQMYSCTLDLADKKSYLEVFKYAIKSFDEEQNHIEFEQFKTLYYALKSRKTIQGYGVFRTRKDRGEIDEDMTNGIHDTIISALCLLDKPIMVHIQDFQVREYMLNSTKFIINRRAIHSWSQDTRDEIDNVIRNVLETFYNQRRKVDTGFKVRYRYFEDFEKSFVDRSIQRARVFEHMQEARIETQKEKQLAYSERAKARDKYVNERLKEMNIDRKSFLFASTRLKLKVEFNNKFPLEKDIDYTTKKFKKESEDNLKKVFGDL